MSLERLVSSLTPNDYNILGLDLKPFCLSHYFTMLKYKCAFISEVEGESNIDDLLTGLVICSRTHEEFAEFLKLDDNSWLDRTRFWQWSCNRLSFFTYHPLSLKQWVGKWSKSIRRQARQGEFNLIFEFRKFHNYLKDGIEIPVYDIEQESDESRAESGTHWAQNLLHVLTKELGFSESYALNMPISSAFAHYFKHLESEGIITINTDEDAALFKENK